MEQHSYIGYLRDFILYKLETFDKKKIKEDFVLLEFKDNVKKADNINDLYLACKYLSSKGLKQIATLFNPLKNFFEYLEGSSKKFEEINQKFIDEFINKTCVELKLSYGTRNNYKTTLISFFTYLNSVCKLKKKYVLDNIKVEKDGAKINSAGGNADWLSALSLAEVNSKITEYFKDDNMEKHRDILIFRLFCFSGILPNEMSSLTMDSFVIKNDSMYLKIKGDSNSKNREIPLPKKHIIGCFDRYVRTRSKQIKWFFYNKDEGQMEVSYLAEVVKKLLDFCKVDIKDKTPKMLRKTYALLLNNEKNKNGFTQPEQNIKYLLGLANTTQLRDILRYTTVDKATSIEIFENFN